MNVAKNSPEIQSRVTRRSMIAGLTAGAVATPAAAFVGPITDAPAAPDMPEWWKGKTRILALYREWSAQDAAIEATSGMTDDELDAATDEMNATLNEMLAIPSVCAADIVAKLLALTFNGSADLGIDEGAGTWAEARTLIGEAA